MDRKSGQVPSQEWIGSKVGFPHGDPRKRSSKLTMLRNKIMNHRKSAAHIASATVHEKKAKLSKTQEQLADQYVKYQSSTEKVFTLAYHNAKLNRPFTDLPSDIDCYKVIGVDMGQLLHTDKSSTAIIKSIAADMRVSLLKAILSNESKISILVDESTTVSGKSALVIHLRACVEGKPTTIFLDLIHLLATDAKSITDAIMASLKQHGFSDEYLTSHFLCFASDGASVMTGTKSGVGTLLLEKFPDLLLWHCANHRLELAVNDAIDEVSGINPFKIFIDSLYSLYSQSPKLQQELKECAASVDGELRKIGRVLDTRWSASSLRTVRAVWTSYESLLTQFQAKQSAKFVGLVNTLTSPKFILNLGIMYDALEELSHLSVLLQSRDMTLVRAHRLIDQCIKAMQGMSERPGKWQEISLQAVESGEFKSVQLGAGRVVAIKPGQFFQSLASSLASRLLTVRSRRGEKAAVAYKNSAEYADLLRQVSLLDSATWPTDYDEIPSFGERELSELCARYRVDRTDAIRGFKLF